MLPRYMSTLRTGRQRLGTSVPPRTPIPDTCPVCHLWATCSLPDAFPAQLSFQATHSSGYLELTLHGGLALSLWVHRLAGKSWELVLTSLWESTSLTTLVVVPWIDVTHLYYHDWHTNTYMHTHTCMCTCPHTQKIYPRHTHMG